MNDISPEFAKWLETDPKAIAFTLMRQGKTLPLSLIIRLLPGVIFTDPFLHILRYYPGAIGIRLRQMYYRCKLKSMGKNVVIDEGVFIDGAKNISISDYVWVDKNVRLTANW